MKRLLCIMLSLIVTVTALNITAFGAFADDRIELEYTQNPFYAHREVATGSLEAYTVQESVARKYNNKTYYSRGKKLYKTLTSGLAKRNLKITLRYLATAPITNAFTLSRITDELFVEATDDSMSSSCTDGDYVRWSTAGWQSNLQHNNTANGYYYYTINFEVTYYDSADEEKKVDSVVNTFLNNTNTSGMSDYQILKKVHDFICSKTSYCNDATYNPYGNLYAYSAYGALVKGSSVCQGYSLAFYRLCRELGFKARIITSEYLVWFNDQPEIQGHAWNLVGLNGKYYYVDTTWDDENDVKRYKFFLVNYSDLRKDDSYSEHIPEEKYYDGEYYNETYAEKIDTESYDSKNKKLLSNCTVSLSKTRFAYSGNAFKPQVTVNSPDGTKLAASDFTVKYTGNTDPGYGKVYLYGAGEYTGTSRRLFIIIPEKMGNLSLANGGRGATSVKLKWKAATGVTGYRIEIRKKDGWKSVATVPSGTTTAVIKSLKAASTCYFRIRAYRSFSKRNFYGAYSNTYKVYTRPQRPSVTLTTKSKTVVAKWKSVSASGFQIQCCTKKNFSSNVKTYKTKSKATQKTIKPLKSKTRYYVRVRAYKVIDKKTYYSSWSAVKSIKCK